MNLFLGDVRMAAYHPPWQAMEWPLGKDASPWRSSRLSFSCTSKLHRGWGAKTRPCAEIGCEFWFIVEPKGWADA